MNRENLAKASARAADNEKTAHAYVPEQFNDEIARLKTALEDMDAGAINQAVDNLAKLACADELKNVIRKVSMHILMAEYDEAVALLESF